MIKTTETSKNVILGTNAYQITENLLKKGAINKLMKMMNHLQIITHIPTMDVNVPGNAMKFFSTMMPIVTFDLLESFKFY